MPNSAEAVAREILGDCRCHEAYTSRNMIDPGCAWHGYHQEFKDALTAFAAPQVREAARRVWAAAANELERYSHFHPSFGALSLRDEFRRRAHQTCASP